MRGSNDKDDTKKCANQVYENVQTRCKNRETCRVLVQDSLCHVPPIREIPYVINATYACNGKLTIYIYKIKQQKKKTVCDNYVLCTI